MGFSAVSECRNADDVPGFWHSISAGAITLVISQLIKNDLSAPPREGLLARKMH